MSRITLLSAIFLSVTAGIASADQTPTVQAAPTPAVQATPTHIAPKASDPTARYHRFICLVHLTGSGKQGDPMLPEYAPASAQATRSGIIAWSMQLTDDGQMAIVHYVAVDRSAFAPILADARPEIRIFEIGKDKPTVIETEIRKYKKNFTLEDFQVVAQ